MSTAKPFKAGMVMFVLGFLAFVAAPYGVYHYRDEAAERAVSYTQEQREYKAGDFARAFDTYLDETRLQRWALFAIQFAGLGLACWGASLVRKQPERP